jgi:hypothetical protein
MPRIGGRVVSERTRLQGQLKLHKANGLTTIHLGNASNEDMKTEVKRIEKKVKRNEMDKKFSNIGGIMIQQKEKIDNEANLLKFADEMMTEHVMKERKDAKIFHNSEFANDGEINYKALETRDWVCVHEDKNGMAKDLKLFINRNVIQKPDPLCIGENLGEITLEIFMEHFEKKTVKALDDVFIDFAAGMKFKFSVLLIMQRVNGDDIQLSELFLTVYHPTSIIDRSTIAEEFKKQFEEFDTPNGPSNLTFFSFVSAYIKCDKFQPIAGGSFMNTPKFLAV